MTKQQIKLILKLLSVGDNKIKHILDNLPDEITHDTIDWITREATVKGW